jgi:tetratricopeptide (TPR) repeat protein
MKKNLFFTILLGLCVQTAYSQNTPKWLDKAERAVFSVITYDANDKILSNGNGFFVSEDGIGVSDFTTFKNAKRAVVVGADGKQLPVTCIMGVNSLYDAVKFRVAVDKKVSALSLALSSAPTGSEVYLIPYATQKERTCTTGKVKESTRIEGKYSYYTFSMPLGEKMVSCPIANSQGEVVALAQKGVGAETTTTSYGLDATYANNLSINIMSANDTSLKAIGIKKDLPEKEDQALVYLYMSSSLMNSAEYTEMLNDFVAKFPDSSDGYMKRAVNYAATDNDGSNIELADKDLTNAIKLAKNRDDALYNSAKLIYSYALVEHQKPYKAWTLDKALSDIKEAISINPLPLYTQVEADIMFAMKNYEGALTAYQTVNQSSISSATSYYATAMTMQMLKRDTKDVIAMMDSCITRCPAPYTADTAPYLLYRAQMYMDTKQYRPALQDYNAYYDSRSGDVNDVFYYYREQAALQAHQYQMALDDIQAAIDKNPNEMVYRVEQGALNLRVGRFDEAISQLKKAISIDPKYGEAYRILGLCYIQKKNNQEACTNFNKAKDLGDPNAQTLIDKYCK